MKLLLLLSGCLAAAGLSRSEMARPGLPPLPAHARLAFQENWEKGTIAPDRWYVLNKKWGQGNSGVVPDNVCVSRERVEGTEKNVLVCSANGDDYDGPITGHGGSRTRVGGVLVTKARFASGRFQVSMKIGEATPGVSKIPRGSVPAIWTYGHRAVRVPDTDKDRFVPAQPLYNPHFNGYGIGLNEYWSELDFPELGKNGDFSRGLYNTYCQDRHDWQTFTVPDLLDGQYHTFTTEWRTCLKPLTNITDSQVVEHEGFWWIKDPTVAFDTYLGNPLKRFGPDCYSVHAGLVVQHWIDGRKIGENTRNVPCMAAQLNLGIWLPEWAGPALWKTATVSFSSIKIWQFDDEGDVRGILRNDIE